MIDKLIQLMVAVVVILLLAWFLQWAMNKLAAADMIQTVVWILFGLIVILAAAGLLGYGPFKGSWKSTP